MECEQWCDLHWATDVIAGRGDSSDDLLAATNMLRTLVKHGATMQIKSAAWLAIDTSMKAVM